MSRPHPGPNGVLTLTFRLDAVGNCADRGPDASFLIGWAPSEVSDTAMNVHRTNLGCYVHPSLCKVYGQGQPTQGSNFIMFARSFVFSPPSLFFLCIYIYWFIEEMQLNFYTTLQITHQNIFPPVMLFLKKTHRGGYPVFACAPRGDGAHLFVDL
jgi:hypothetical protein